MEISEKPLNKQCKSQSVKQKHGHQESGNGEGYPPKFRKKRKAAARKPKHQKNVERTPVANVKSWLKMAKLVTPFRGREKPRPASFAVLSSHLCLSILEITVSLSPSVLPVFQGVEPVLNPSNTTSYRRFLCWAVNQLCHRSGTRLGTPYCVTGVYIVLENRNTASSLT